jgi:hypothetical protein
MTLRHEVGGGGMVHNRNHFDANAQSVGGAQGVASFPAVAPAPSSLAKVKVDMNLSISRSNEIKLEYGGQSGSGYRSNEGTLCANGLLQAVTVRVVAC